MKRLLILSILISISGCSKASTYETLEVNGQEIKLDVETCQIHYESQITKIDINKKCYFIKENNTDIVRVKHYADIASYVALIVGDSLPKNPEYPFTMSREDCGSTLKALIIGKDTISLSKKRLTETITCAGMGSDEKEFYILSH